MYRVGWISRWSTVNQTYILLPPFHNLEQVATPPIAGVLKVKAMKIANFGDRFVHAVAVAPTDSTVDTADNLDQPVPKKPQIRRFWRLMGLQWPSSRKSPIGPPRIFGSVMMVWYGAVDGRMIMPLFNASLFGRP